MVMHQKKHLPLGQIIFRGRFLNLLVYILVLIAIQPLDEAIGEFGLLLDIIVSFVLISAIYAVSHKNTHTILGILLAVPLLTSMWTKQLLGIQWMQIPETIFGLAFFIFIIVIILRFIFHNDEINRDLIAGAAAVYLLLAIAWAYAYRAIEVLQPGSFAIADAQNITYSISLYYSFVTITTLGYGDIFPVTTAAKSCAILEAIVGQLYLVITIALLVGVHVSQTLAKKSSSNKSDNHEQH
jgi:hypothetical protein